MSHVDEGRLHAFLDGALSAVDPADAERVELHLAVCADCRARLEEAGRLRDQAAALLGGATPAAFETPSFDAIRARADAIATAAAAGDGDGAAQSSGARTTRPRGRWRGAVFATPFNGLAWAATLVLAVGLGWLLHDTIEQPGMRPIATTAGDAARRAARSAESIEVPAAPVSGGAGEAADAPATGDAGQAADDLAAVDEVESGERRAAARETRDEMAAAPAPAPTTRPTETPSIAAQAPAPPPPAARPATPERAAARADYGVEMEAGAGVGAAQAPNVADAGGWRPVTIEEAYRLAEGDLAVLDDARVTAVARRGGGLDLQIRTVQVTARGETVELVQRREPTVESLEAAAADAPSPAAADAPAQAAWPMAVRWRDWTVTIFRPLDADRAEALLGELPAEADHEE